LRVADGPEFRIGVVAPESDFLGEVHAQRTFVLVLTVAALLVAGVISMVLARRYSRPIDQLVEQSERIRNLDLRAGVSSPTNLREMAKLGEAQERMRVALDAFARYVPTEVVRELLDRGEAAHIGGRSRSLTILFSDIEGFTSISESMSPEALTGHMASYFDALVQILRKGHGTIDKFVGDAIVAFWGAPRPDEDHARNAVESVYRCTEALDRLNREWEAEGLPPLPTRFGLSTGDVVVGNVGTPSRLSYTVLGDAVNLASRLEGTNRVYGTRVLASTATRKAAGDDFHWRKVDVVRVKGREEPEALYELLGPRGEVDPGRLAWAAQYEEALEQYHAREFAAVGRILERAEALRPGDLSVRRLAELARRYEAESPPEDWDPVTRRVTK
ncbi:MAG: adenylate/guanylate cyclase domain-containing protein, partial [Planctomycetota bacterium]